MVCGRSSGFVVFIPFKNPTIVSEYNFPVNTYWRVKESVCLCDAPR